MKTTKPRTVHEVLVAARKVLTPRGASFWLGSGRQLANTSGTLHLRLRGGLIREFRITAEGEKAAGRDGSDRVHVEFESTTTFSYARPPAVPFEAKQKLNEASLSSRP